MPQLKLGSVLCLALVLLSSCREDKPPKISIICIGDGFGGADCVTSNNERIYRSPSQLKNFWMTTQTDQENFASWCYETTPRAVRVGMREIKERAQ